MITDTQRQDQVLAHHVADLVDLGAVRLGAEEIVDWLLAECPIEAKRENLTRAVWELFDLGVFRY